MIVDGFRLMCSHFVMLHNSDYTIFPLYHLSHVEDCTEVGTNRIFAAFHHIIWI